MHPFPVLSPAPNSTWWSFTNVCWSMDMACLPGVLSYMIDNETTASGHVIVYGEQHTSFFSADFLLVSYVVVASRSIPLRLSLFHATNFLFLLLTFLSKTKTEQQITQLRSYTHYHAIYTYIYRLSYTIHPLPYALILFPFP